MALVTGAASSFITFTRASTATRINSNGLIEVVSSNTPRLDYDPVDVGTCKGLLVEEQRTNLLLQSHNASSSPWSAVYASVTPNAAVSPFGTMTASKIVENTTNNVHILSQSVSVATGSYTFSCYLKPAGRSFSQIIWQDATPSYFSAFFDLANGVVSSTGANTTATIMPAGDGWWRCSITGTSSTGGTGGVTIRTAISSNSSSYTGDGTSGLYFGGAQFEAGSFATSYIPTTSETVTRSADVASVATSAFPYNASAGTIIINGTTPDANSINPGGGVPALVAFTDQTANNRVQLIRSASGNNMVYGVFSGGLSQASLTTTTSWSNNTTNKIAAAWASDDFAVAFQTDAILTDTSGILPVGITKLNIGSRDGTSYWCGWIRQITYIPRRLSNAELQARTA